VAEENRGLIARLGVAGYEKIEPAIVTCWALGWPIRLAGRPGTAKTFVADLLSMAENGRAYWRRFDCPKENVITIAGLPDMKAIERGVFKFVSEVEEGKMSSFVWGKRNLVFNEFTRMSAEAQNLLLEVLQERTFFGQDLPTKRMRDPNDVHYSLIATENPEGIGVRRTDEALMDRFYMTVNVPDGQTAIDEGQRRGIVGSNLFQYDRDPEGREPLLAAFAVQLRRELGHLLNDASIVEPIIKYGVFLWNSFFDSERGVYVSNRRQAMLTEMILGFVAYQRLTGERPNLKEAASLALNYGVILPLKLTHDQANGLLRCHDKAAIYLAAEEMEPAEKLAAELLMRPLMKDKVRYLLEHRTEFTELLKLDEREKILGEFIKESSGTDLLEVHRLIKALGSHEELLRKQEIRIVGAVSRAISQLRQNVSGLLVHSFEESEVFELFRRFLDFVERGEVPAGIVRLLLAPQASSLEGQLRELVLIADRAATARNPQPGTAGTTVA